MFYEVVPAKQIGSSSVGFLTYSFEEDLKPGTIVLIPLRKSQVPGIVIQQIPAPDFATKEIKKVLYQDPLPPHLLKSLLWLSEYYLNPLPSIASAILPSGVEKSRRKSVAKAQSDFSPTDFPLNAAQKEALSRIKSTSTATKLLFGITGSGKTNVYLELAKETLKNHQSVILLVPEIALTSQLVQIFEQTFQKNVILLHSRQTDATRHGLWEQILKAESPQIIIGPRSALFAPIKNLGLIIIDEAHETSFYQENSPRYSATRLASFIAGTLHITCLLGTATPLVSDYFLAQKKQALIPLTTKAKQAVAPPKVHIIDFKNREKFNKNRYFSDPLLKSIEANLKNHRQTLIFHNRRGSAPLTICENCGWQALCPTCFLPLTLHADSYHLLCHTCGRTEKIPMDCPNCHHPGIIHKGFGTKLLETELKKIFENARIARFDADNKKSDSLDILYDKVKNGDFDIIIGTQTIAKGLDLPLLATVGIAQADAGLSLPDFAAEEHTFELLTQVIGRVGRGHQDIAEVFIQTYQPDHPAITLAATSDYESFSNYLLKNRKKAHLPPFTYLAQISLTYQTEATVLKHIKSCHQSLSHFPGLLISAPTPAFHERSSKGYTWQLTLKSTSRKTLLAALVSLKKISGLRITLDPPTLLGS